MRLEHFPNNGDVDFRVHSTKQMLKILQNVAEQGSRVALYYDSSDHFTVTTLLAADEKQVYLELSPDELTNQLVLQGHALTVVGLYEGVKIQFTARAARRATFENKDVFCVTLPDYLLRIQRRGFFRMPIPASTPIHISIPIKSNDPDELPVIREIPIMNISGGGIALQCDGYENALRPREFFKDCHISLPGIGDLTVTIQVISCVDLSTEDDQAFTYLGCTLIDLDSKTENLLQRYITRLQGEVLTPHH